MSNRGHRKLQDAQDKTAARNMRGLTPDDQPAGPREHKCGACNKGFRCTKKTGHPSRHVAHNATNNVLHRWYSEVSAV